METNRILAELNAERARLDRAISAIESLNSTGNRRGRPPGSTNAPKKRGRRQLNPAARRKLSRLLKQRWAQGKMGKKASAKPTQASKLARRMSAAGRNRISQAAKRRWAEWRKRAKAT